MANDRSLRELAALGATQPAAMEPDDVSRICRALVEMLDEEDDVIVRSRVVKPSTAQSVRRRLA